MTREKERKHWTRLLNGRGGFELAKSLQIARRRDQAAALAVLERDVSRNRTALWRRYR